MQNVYILLVNWKGTDVVFHDVFSSKEKVEKEVESFKDYKGYTVLERIVK